MSDLRLIRLASDPASNGIKLRTQRVLDLVLNLAFKLCI